VKQIKKRNIAGDKGGVRLTIKWANQLRGGCRKKTQPKKNRNICENFISGGRSRRGGVEVPGKVSDLGRGGVQKE